MSPGRNGISQLLKDPNFLKIDLFKPEGFLQTIRPVYKNVAFYHV